MEKRLSPRCGETKKEDRRLAMNGRPSEEQAQDRRPMEPTSTETRERWKRNEQIRGAVKPVKSEEVRVG